MSTPTPSSPFVGDPRQPVATPAEVAKGELGAGVTTYTDKRKVPFLIDAADAFAVSRYTWSMSSRGYPITKIGRGPTKRSIFLHAFLLGPAGPGLEWDHINRDKLDTRRANLRRATRTLNTRNTLAKRSNNSGFKGVSWHKGKGRWESHIRVHGQPRKWLGYFPTVDAAVAARRGAEQQLWGDAR